MSFQELQLQQVLFDTQMGVKTTGKFPQTRYQGSKYKLLEWLKYHFEKLDFETALDAFGGTGSVSYLLKQMGKEVIYNDYLKFNSIIAKALIQNNQTFLSSSTLDFILTRHQDIFYPSFISTTFKDIYFTNKENFWLDQTITNIKFIENEYEQALAYFALFQSCIIKRPYNLFHRKNLYVRTAEVKRSFGNKKTWDTPFEKMFIKFVEQANAAVFDNGKNHQVHQEDVLKLNIPSPDLVYIDPPYISKKGTGVNYFEFYHFLEGLVDYDNWKNKIDFNSKHKKLQSKKSLWTDKAQITSAFQELFQKHKDSILVISYRSDGIPSVSKLVNMLEEIGKKVEVNTADYKYVLSNSKSQEVLIVGR